MHDSGVEDEFTSRSFLTARITQRAATAKNYFPRQLAVGYQGRAEAPDYISFRHLVVDSLKRRHKACPGMLLGQGPAPTEHEYLGIDYSLLDIDYSPFLINFLGVLGVFALQEFIRPLNTDYQPQDK